MIVFAEWVLRIVGSSAPRDVEGDICRAVCVGAVLSSLFSVACYFSHNSLVVGMDFECNVPYFECD